MTQKEIIYNLLKDNGGWVVSYNLIKVDTKYGWLGTGADRLARYLVEDGTIERKQDGKYAYYRIRPQENRLFNLEPMLTNEPIVNKKDLVKYQ